MNFNKIHRSTPVKPIEQELPLSPEGLFEMPKRVLGSEIDNNYSALYFFEHYIDYYKFEYVVEFGARDGGLSLFLANMAAVTEQFLFHTFELYKDRDWYNRAKGGVGHWFDKLETQTEFIKSYSLSVFSDEAQEIVKTNISKYKTLIFCDNGDKPREFKLYAPLIKSGDHILVHDWGTGIYQNQIQDTINSEKLILNEPWSTSCENLKNLIRPFKKV